MKEIIKKGILYLAVLMSLLLICGCGKKTEDDTVLDSYHEYIKVLNEDLCADIIIKGNTAYVDSELNFRTADEINSDTVFADIDYGYQAIVIIDIEGNVNLSDEEMEFLYTYLVDENRDVMYFGTQYLSKFTDLLSISPIDNPEFEGMGIYGSFPEDFSKLGIGICLGVWTSYDTGVYKEKGYEWKLTESIISELEYVATGEAYD